MATKQKKLVAKKPRAVTRRSATKANTVSATNQFTSTMVTAFAVLSIVFLLVVIQNYL